MPIKFPTRREETRYPVPPGFELFLEFTPPQGKRCSFPLIEISSGGAGFVIPERITGFEKGVMIADGIIRFGKLEIRVNFAVQHLTRDFDTRYRCGVMFFPCSETDRNELIGLTARLETLQRNGP